MTNEKKCITMDDAREVIWRILNNMGISQKHNWSLVEEVEAMLDEYPAVDVDMRLCSHCGEREVYAKGLCRSCYYRKKKRGTFDYGYDYDRKQTWEEIKDFDFSVLTERETAILLSRYKHNKTYQEIGDSLHLSKQRIFQIRRDAMRKLLINSREAKA